MVPSRKKLGALWFQAEKNRGIMVPSRKKLGALGFQAEKKLGHGSKHLTKI